MDHVAGGLFVGVDCMLYAVFYSNLRADKNFAENTMARFYDLWRVDGEGDAVCRRGVVKVEFMKFADFSFIDKVEDNFIASNPQLMKQERDHLFNRFS